MNINTEKLESERKRLGLKKFQFCKMLGINPSTYTYILNNKTQKLSTLSKISKVLNIKPSDLFV